MCLFHGVTDFRVLALLSHKAGESGRFAAVGAEDWHDALDDAARVGLLTPLDGVMYQVHPALPAYLAAQWRADDPDGYDSVRDAATRALATAYAVLGGQLREQLGSGDAGSAYMVIELQRRTMDALLRYTLDHQLWEEAEAIAVPLMYYWDAHGLDEEADAWTDRVQIATKDLDGRPPS